MQSDNAPSESPSGQEMDLDGSVLSTIADRGGYKDIRSLFDANRESPTDRSENNKSQKKNSKAKATGNS